MSDPAKEELAPRIWFDVEDLFHFAQRNARPTGIQRVSFEIYRAMAADPATASRAGFLRHSTVERGFVEADWADLAAMFRRVTERSPEPAAAALAGSPAAAAPPARLPDVPPELLAAAPRSSRPLPIRLLKRATGRVPERIRRPLVLSTVMQAQALAALAATAGFVLGAGIRRGAVRFRGLRLKLPALAATGGEPAASPVPRRLADIARRGDLLVVLGSPWFELDYAELAAFARGRLGMRLAVLLYDVIPVRRPEWVDRGTTRVFRDWYATVLPLADIVFAISRATAEDATLWCRRDNIALAGPIQPLALGTGFGDDLASADASSDESAAGASTDVPPPELVQALHGRPYVLFVSTIEARKNHMLLFRVWRRLLEEMDPAAVPDLVFAGKVGWLVADLMSQIENSRNLDGRLHVIEGLDDQALRAVYRGCLFTVFPSFYEGWGLPVSESLAMGKPCIAANVTALPEAGGGLARYFDPFDLNDAMRVIRATIEDRAGLAAWQDEVRRAFRPVGWDRTARALVAALDVTTAAVPSDPR